MFNRKKVKCAFNVTDHSKFKTNYPNIKIEENIYITCDDAWLVIGKLFLDEYMEMTKREKADPNLLSIDLMTENSNDSKKSSEDEHRIFLSPNPHNF